MHGTHIEDLTDRIKPRTASSILLWVIVAFVLAFFIWASFAEIERTVRSLPRATSSDNAK